jgi:hypothetical protein
LRTRVGNGLRVIGQPTDSCDRRVDLAHLINKSLLVLCLAMGFPACVLNC